MNTSKTFAGNVKTFEQLTIIQDTVNFALIPLLAQSENLELSRYHHS